jgi:hypothetical protein
VSSNLTPSANCLFDVIHPWPWPHEISVQGAAIAPWPLFLARL